MKTISFQNSPLRQRNLTSKGLKFTVDGFNLIVEMPAGSENMFVFDFIHKYASNRKN